MGWKWKFSKKVFKEKSPKHYILFPFLQEILKIFVSLNESEETKSST